MSAVLGARRNVAEMRWDRTYPVSAGELASEIFEPPYNTDGGARAALPFVGDVFDDR
jgi:hypothetical protein